MSKIGVIDIGSNTVRLVIFDGLSRAPHYVFNEKAQCRLGEGLASTGKLSLSGVELARESLERFVYLARAVKVSTLDIVGTAALREASNGSEFVRDIEEWLNVKIQIIDGEVEAELSAKGVLLGWPQADGIVCDIGGSSLELIAIHKGKVGRGISLKLGPLRLKTMTETARKEFISSELRRAQAWLGEANCPIYLVGGSWRALGRLDMLRRNYPFHILHEYVLPLDSIDKTHHFLNERPQVLEAAEISEGRAELLPFAFEVLSSVTKVFQPTQYLLSAYGLREGVFYDRLDEKRRNADPLLIACQEMEKSNARFPGFGEKLFDWLMPLYKDASPEYLRMIKAACYLHDTNWRYHPDFREQMSFEVIAQANICGVTHEDRIFLALALASRYKNTPNHAYSHPALEILSVDVRDKAIELGRALRLGAMISAAVIDLLEKTRLELTSTKLILSIDKSMQGIYGESIGKRLEQLGKVSDRAVEVVYTD